MKAGPVAAGDAGVDMIPKARADKLEVDMRHQVLLLLQQEMTVIQYFYFNQTKVMVQQLFRDFLFIFQF